MNLSYLVIGLNIRIQLFFHITVFILSFSFLHENLQSQIRETEIFGLKLNGTADIYSNYYTSDGRDPEPSESSIRAIIFSTVDVSDKIEMPVTMYISTQSDKHQQPFNQIGLSPVFSKWLTVHAGYFSSKLSNLTFGDHTLLGGGIEKKDGNFRFSLLYGRMLASIEPDTNNEFLGNFRREVFAFKVGFGEKEKSYVDLNIAKMYDNSSSIDTKPNGLHPYENAVGSLSFGTNLFKEKINIKGEAAFCAFSNDTRIDENKDVHVGPLRVFLIPRYSSSIDGAMVLNIKYKPNENYYFGFESKLVGPGYVTLSYPQLQNDVFENTLHSKLNLLTNKLFLTTAVTLRVNDLRDTRFAASKTFTGLLTSLWRPSNKFTLNFQYLQYSINSNPNIKSLDVSFQIDSVTKVDSTIEGSILEIDNITRSVSISPTFYFSLFKNPSNILLTYSYRWFKDNNIQTSSLNKSTLHDIGGTWSVNFPTSLFLSAGLDFTSTKIANMETRITAIGQSIGYSLFKGKMNITSNFNYSFTGGSNSGRQISENLTCTYLLEMLGRLNLNAFLNSFKNISDFQLTLRYIYDF